MLIDTIELKNILTTELGKAGIKANVELLIKNSARALTGKQATVRRYAPILARLGWCEYATLPSEYEIAQELRQFKTKLQQIRAKTLQYKKPESSVASSVKIKTGAKAIHNKLFLAVKALKIEQKHALTRQKQTKTTKRITKEQKMAIDKNLLAADENGLYPVARNPKKLKPAKHHQVFIGDFKFENVF